MSGPSVDLPYAGGSLRFLHWASGDIRCKSLAEATSLSPSRVSGWTVAACIPCSQLTPIPLDEAVASLSAILLDEVYYAFIMAGRREVDGLPWVGEDRLIPLKAIAWLDLTARKEEGAKVDAKDVRKHLNDVLRLSQLLAPATRIPVDKKIGDDMTRFLVAVAADTSIDPKTLQLGKVAVAELVARIAQAYELEMPAQAAG